MIYIAKIQKVISVNASLPFPDTDNKARGMCKTEDCLKGLKLVKLVKIPCDDFLVMGLKYQHIDPPSPDRDYIHIRLDLKDTRSGSIYQVFQLLFLSNNKATKLNCCLVTK